MIYIVWAPPKKGKTYFVTMKAVKEILKGKRKVISNYPIVFHRPLSGMQSLRNFAVKVIKRFKIKRFESLELVEGELLCSLVWEDKFLQGGIQDSMIILDEAYEKVGSRDYRSFTKKTHTFFATNGHDDNDFWLIAQHPARIDIIIREMVNIFYYIKKIGFGEKALLFIANGYLSEDDFVKRKSDKSSVYSRNIIFPSELVQGAYNYKFFRNPSPNELYETWVEKLRREKKNHA